MLHGITLLWTFNDAFYIILPLSIKKVKEEAVKNPHARGRGGKLN
jgi:hypothetical protein